MILDALGEDLRKKQQKGRCSRCGGRSKEFYQGRCMRCTSVALAESLDAISRPVSVFLMENGLAKKDEPMPTGDDLLELLRSTLKEKAE